MNEAIKSAKIEAPILLLLAERWSPYVFSDKPVADEDLSALFEAARWAPSSYNEQPWRYIVARKGQDAHYDTVLSCLVEGNQAWAKAAPVLMLGVIMKPLAMSGKPNRAALHDLGAASMSLTAEATHRGLHVHQMIGIEPEKVRTQFSLPDDAEAYTGLAIGYLGDPEQANEALKTRDSTPRTRRNVNEFIFGASWGKAL